MEDLKIKVSNESESKEAQELFFELGFSWFGGAKEYCEYTNTYISIIGGLLGVGDGNYVSDDNEVTLQQLRDMVVLKRNDVGDATHENAMYPYVKLSDGWYYFDKGESNKWLKSEGGHPSYYENLKPIEKPMTETEYLMQGKNGERLMESVGQVKSSQWDVQVGGNHYKSMKIQPAQFALENKLDYCQANAIKYICRHQSKNGKQDLEKAKHYIDLLIEHYYGGEI